MGEKSKPKPRVAVYAGLAAGGIFAVSGGDLKHPPTLARNTADVRGNLERGLADPWGSVARVGIPVALGLGASIVADKLGVNKKLAQMRMGWRV